MALVITIDDHTWFLLSEVRMVSREGECKNQIWFKGCDVTLIITYPTREIRELALKHLMDAMAGFTEGYAAPSRLVDKDSCGRVKMGDPEDLSTPLKPVPPPPPVVEPPLTPAKLMSVLSPPRKPWWPWWPRKGNSQ